MSDQQTARALIDSGNARLPQDLVARMHAEEDMWPFWVDPYRQSAQAIHLEFNTMTPNSVPD